MNKKTFLLITGIVCFAAASAQQQQTVTVQVGNSFAVNMGEAIPQKEIGKSVMEFMYDYKYLTDTADVTSRKTDRMILQVTYGMSKFSSFRAMQIDSLLRESSPEQIKANPGRFIGGETFSVYKNYPAGKFTNTDKISTDWFLYEEDIPVQEWNLIDETKSILGYDCKKATCKFRGREYEAWYTEDVPVSEGPWKFGGLPGFIMEIHDANNQYSYECVGINSSPDRTITIPDIPYNKTNRGKFYQTKYRFDTNPIEYMESTSGVKVIVSSPDGTPRNDLYGPRELNYDYIELDWK